MTATANTEHTPAEPTENQVLAAKIRMKADRRLNRPSPEWIKAIAADDIESAATRNDE